MTRAGDNPRLIVATRGRNSFSRNRSLATVVSWSLTVAVHRWVLLILFTCAFDLTFYFSYFANWTVQKGRQGEKENGTKVHARTQITSDHIRSHVDKCYSNECEHENTWPRREKSPHIVIYTHSSVWTHFFSPDIFLLLHAERKEGITAGFYAWGMLHFL